MSKYYGILQCCSQQSTRSGQLAFDTGLAAFDNGEMVIKLMCCCMKAAPGRGLIRSATSTLW